MLAYWLGNHVRVESRAAVVGNTPTNRIPACGLRSNELRGNDLYCEETLMANGASTRGSELPAVCSSRYETGEESKKMLRMKVALDELLKTKGQKKCSG